MQVNCDFEPWTISDQVAEMIADQTIDRDFNNESNRVFGLSEVNEIETVEDYFYVTALVDVPEMTDCTRRELLEIDSMDEFISTVVQAFFESLTLRECFRVLDIEDIGAQRYELPVMNDDFVTPRVAEEDDFPRTDMSYETKTVDRKHWGVKSTLGSPREHYSFFGWLNRLIGQMRDRIFEVLPERESREEGFYDAVIEGYHRLQEENFTPDSVYVGRSPSAIAEENEQAIVAGTNVEPSILGCELTEASGLGGNEFVIVDTDHFGYETVWKDLEWHSYEDLDVFAGPFRSVTLEVKTGLNWMDAREDALYRGTYDGQ